MDEILTKFSEVLNSGVIKIETVNHLDANERELQRVNKYNFMDNQTYLVLFVFNRIF
jgi:hypothetical protein